MWIEDIVKVAKNEIKKIVRDTNLLALFFLGPVFYPVLYGLIYIDKVETRVPIGIMDADNSSLSRGLIREFNSHQNLKIDKVLYSEQEVENYLKLQNGNAVVMIPADFSKKIYNKERAGIELFLSPNRLLVVSDIGFPISQLANYYSTKISAKLLESKGVPAARYKYLLSPINIKFINLFNPYIAYGDMVLSLLFTMILIQVMTVASATSSAKEWDSKWMNTFNASKNPLIIFFGKYFIIISIYIISSILVFLLWVPIFDIHLAAKSLNLLLVMIVTLSSSAAFGLFLGTFFRHKITVLLFAGFLTYPFFFSSGVVWPEQQLPMIIQYIGYTLPTTPALRSIFFMGQMGANMSIIQNYLIIGGLQFMIYSILYMLRIHKIKDLSLKSNENIDNKDLIVDNN